IEGFGMVLLEAQASGTPVVAGDSGGTAETLSPGVTGFVVPCETPEPVAKVLAELLADPTRCQTMGLAARQWAVDHFDWTALSRQAAELFGVPLDRLAPDRTEKT
ncbi:MAG TPA: glycosyltransferase family 4 protein, partial [Planctomycetaceae bacterium]|nr:glycosyltransferase family 4 protein [Planctomycetaceae bacterium]